MKYNKAKLKKQLTPNAKQKFVLEEYLFDKQLQFVRDPAPFKIAVTTRRAGKSISCVADLVDSALNTPDVICLYITLSRKNAKRLVWPEFKKLNRRFSLGGEPNESDLSLTFPNGSIIYLLGAKDRGSIEDFRGLPVKKVYLDEGQSFPDYMRELIDDVLGPCLMDYAGSMCLIGTPGPIPAGYFYEISRSTTWAHHSWTFFDNPHIPIKSGKTHQELLDRELNRRGVDTTNPSIRREWFGEWVLDSDALVYKYVREKANYEDLPSGNYNYILGVDLGFDDADAIAVIAWNEKSKETWLVEEVITNRQGITELCQQIEELRKKYAVSKIVIDTGALGKKITEEITRRFKIPMQPAEKTRKWEYIELMNDAMRTGGLRAKSTSTFAQDCMKVEWDTDKMSPDRRVVSKRYHSDICDAVLYAWRESYSFTHSPTKKLPKAGTREYADAEAEAMEEAAQKYFEEQARAEDPYRQD